MRLIKGKLLMLKQNCMFNSSKERKVQVPLLACPIYVSLHAVSMPRSLLVSVSLAPFKKEMGISAYQIKARIFRFDSAFWAFDSFESLNLTFRQKDSLMILLCR